MIFYPDYYCDKVTDITVELLERNNIKGLILDVDNTLIDYDKNLLKGADEWVKRLKEKGLKFMILSNSNQEEKVKNVANVLGIPYFYFATKPLKRGFKKAQKELQLEKNEIAVIGDQIFTDIIGANRSKMFSILVNPVAKKDLFMTKIKRPLEEMIVKSYVKKTKEERGRKKCMISTMCIF